MGIGLCQKSCVGILANSSEFYKDLTAFSDFATVGEVHSYTPLPDDWDILATDVVGSTRAIHQGKYKSVNMAGAASIVCVLNSCAGYEIPFAFGGDGALIAVPPGCADHAARELQRLKFACPALYDLELRVVRIPMTALRTHGHEIGVRKFHLQHKNYLAMFSGDGISAVDHWMKSGEARYQQFSLNHNDGQLPDLEGLSCRWEPLKAKNGVMLTLIADVHAGTGLYNNFADRLASLLGHPVSAFTPVKHENLKFRFPPRGLKLEVISRASEGRPVAIGLWALFTSLMQYLCERFGLKIGDYDGRSYRDELTACTDYRKFDGSFRMVLDLTETQADKVEQWLEEHFQQGALIFGVHRSDSALMTCMLFDLAQSAHVHLIDGANGGYALAAKALKQRIADTQ